MYSAVIMTTGHVHIAHGIQHFTLHYSPCMHMENIAVRNYIVI